MSCANHADREHIAFCQNCGKPLCQECSRVVGTAVFCEPCLAARLAGAPAGADPVTGTPFPPPPPPSSSDTPSPALATLLGFIPGVGAMYNGQYAKGIVHLIVFAILASLGDQSGIFKLFAMGWIIYQAIEANHTARARLTGAPLPNPFGLNDLGERLGFGKSWPTPPASPFPGAPGATYPGQPTGGTSTFTADSHGNVSYASPGANSGANPVTPPAGSYAPPASSYAYPYTAPNWSGTQESYQTSQPYAPYSPVDPNGPLSPPDPYVYNRGSRFPAGAIWLIAIGSIFLVGNFGFFNEFPVRHIVPLLLIGFGIWVFVHKMSCADNISASYNLRVFRALRGAIWIILIGVLLLLDSFQLISWAHSWPLFIIVAGVMALLRTTAYSSMPNTPYPYPATAPASGQPATPSPTTTTDIVLKSDLHGHPDHQEGR